MRSVILGSDLMYDKSGRLVPIEINTNIGYDMSNRVESTDEWLDLSNLVDYVKSKGFKTVLFDTSTAFIFNAFLPNFGKRLKEALPGVNVRGTSENSDSIQDSEDLLYIRISFSTEALIDSYCRDKVLFLETLKSSTLSQEFLYKEGGEVKGVMKSFLDNGEDPNYIVKSRYPVYDSKEYPKYYKLGSLAEVKNLAKALEDDYFIMPCYLNEERMYNGERFVLFRQWSLIVSDEESTLKAIDMGSYTKLSGKVDRSKNVWSKDGELVEGRDNYISKHWMKPVHDLLLDEDDQILMSDGSWKDAKDLKVGEEVLTVDVPHAADVDIKNHVGNYNVDVKEFEGESEYGINQVLSIGKVEGFYELVHMVFEEDDEEWYDTEMSSYPVLNRTTGTVQFKELRDLKVGDKVYLLSIPDPENSQVTYVERTIQDIWSEREFVEGYTVGLDGSHLFISKSPESTASYVSLEHNLSGCRVFCMSLGWDGAFSDNTCTMCLTDLDACNQTHTCQTVQKQGVNMCVCYDN